MTTTYEEDIASLVRGADSQEDDTDPDYAEVRRIMAQEACTEKEAREILRERELLEVQRRNEGKVADAFGNWVRGQREELQRGPALVPAMAEDLLTFAAGPLGAVGYNLMKEGRRGGPPSSPDLVTDFIASAGGELSPEVEAFGRAGVYAFLPGSATANVINRAVQDSRTMQPPPGPSLGEAYRAHRQETEARIIEAASRGPAGMTPEQGRPPARPQPIEPTSLKEATPERRHAVLRQVRPNAFVGMMVDADARLEIIESDLLAAGVSEGFTGRLMESARRRRQRQLEAQRPGGGGGYGLYWHPGRRPMVQ